LLFNRTELESVTGFENVTRRILHRNWPGYTW